MLSRIVNAKLKENRRVMIPGLGMFVMRPDGRVLFSELMTADDGVLRAAVAAENGTGENEAAFAIEKFAGDIRRTLEHGMSYRLEGLGTLSADERGLLVFKEHESEQPKPAERPRSGLESILAASARAERESAEANGAAKAPAAGKPETKPADAQPARPKQRPRPRPQKRRGGTDMFLVVAIIIAVAAIAIMAYGFWVASNRDDSMYGSPVENTSDNGGAAAEEETEVIDLSVPSGR